MTFGKRLGRQRGVGEPTDVGCGSHVIKTRCGKIAGEKKKAAEEEHPKSKGIEPGIRHVACSDHQWHQVVSKPKDPRHGHEKNHRGAVHGEKAVEDVRLQKFTTWKEELHPHQRGHHARDDEEQQARPDVHQAELLVVDRVDKLLDDTGQGTRLLSHTFRWCWYVLLFRFYGRCRISHNI